MEYNPFAPEVRQDPFPYYRELRRAGRVAWVEGLGMYAVPHYQDVRFVFQHPGLFSSGVMAGAVQPETGGRRSQMMGGSIGGSLIGNDPPEHTRLRKIVNRGFTPTRIRALEPRIRQIADDLIAKLEGAREFDLVQELSMPLPVTVIAEILGIEPERREDFKRWSDAVIVGGTGTPSPEERAKFGPLLLEASQYLHHVAAERRREPREDLISALVREEADEGALTPQQVISFTMLLLIAGNETTTNLIGNAMLALHHWPGERERVRANPALIPRMIEETLRYDSPVQFVFRRTTREVELGDTKIPEGARVMQLIGSANRDESRFPDPDRFDIDRDASGHLGFGFATHFCLGAPLARLEARIVFESLFQRLPRLELLDPDCERIDSMLIRGPKSLRFAALAH